MLLQNIGCFSAKPQSISFGKVVHKGIFSEFDFEFNAPQKKKKKKSSFPDILKSFFRRQTTINIPSQNQSLKHSSLSICSKIFDSPITDPYRHSSPLMTLMKEFWNSKAILLNDRDSFFNTVPTSVTLVENELISLIFF